jgi:hypothetical protein
MRVFAVFKKALFFAPVLRVTPKIHAGFRQKEGLRMVAEGKRPQKDPKKAPKGLKKVKKVTFRGI